MSLHWGPSLQLSRKRIGGSLPLSTTEDAGKKFVSSIIYRG